MATDYIGNVYSALWTLLEAHSGFTALVKPGNRIKLNGTSANPFKEQLKDGDLPQVSIGLGTGSDTQYRTTAGYGDTYGATVSGLCNTGLLTQNFTITQITSDLRVGQANPLTHEILTALRKGGPKLGLSYIKEWGPVSWDHAITATDEARGTLRMVVTFSVPVVYQYSVQSNLS